MPMPSKQGSCNDYGIGVEGVRGTLCRVIQVLVIVLTIFTKSEEPDCRVCGRGRFGKEDKYIICERNKFEAGFDN